MVDTDDDDRLAIPKYARGVCCHLLPSSLCRAGFALTNVIPWKIWLSHCAKKPQENKDEPLHRCHRTFPSTLLGVLSNVYICLSVWNWKLAITFYVKRHCLFYEESVYSVNI